MKNLFNSRALQRRHSLGDRVGPITLLSPPLKATLVFGVVLSIAGSLWATMAQIPLTVQGTGILIPADSITTINSQIDGVAMWMFHRPPVEWEQQAWRFMQQPGSFDDQQMTQLARKILQFYSGGANKAQNYNELASIDSIVRFHNTFFPKGRLLMCVLSDSERAGLNSSLDQLERALQASEAQQRNIGFQQVGLRRELRSRSAYLANMKKLESRGFVSHASVLDEQATVDNISSQIDNNNNQLISISRDRDQAYLTLRNQLSTLIQHQMLFATNNAYLDQVIQQNGASVNRGTELLKLSNNPIAGATMVPLFLGYKESAEVLPGMPALATPFGYKRAEVGGIVSKVIFKSALPIGLESISTRVGVPSIAKEIIAKEQSPTLLILEMQRSQRPAGINSGGYLWSSGADLPFPPTQGQMMDVEITTRQVHPIDLVLPKIKQLLGLAPPEPVSSEGPGGITR
jgi:hypothetical protein